MAHVYSMLESVPIEEETSTVKEKISEIKEDLDADYASGSRQDKEKEMVVQGLRALAEPCNALKDKIS